MLDDAVPNADVLLNQSLELTLVRNPVCIIYGRECTMHRSIGFFSRDGSGGYKFSGQEARAEKMPTWLAELTERVATLSECEINAVLVNVYHSGEDYIGFHSDKTNELVKNKSGGACVVALSLGAPRTFRVKSKDGKTIFDVRTGHGQMMVMRGAFQNEFTHGIPVEKKCSSIRVSLTFRHHA